MQLSDGSFLSGSFDGTIKRWLLNGQMLYSINYEGNSFLLLPDGSVIASAGSILIRFNPMTGAIYNTFPSSGAALLLLPDNTFISAGGPSSQYTNEASDFVTLMFNYPFYK